MSATDLLIGICETSLAVAVLIALVLLIRRPVARVFGARAAYALWLAPVTRLFLPDLNIIPVKEVTEFKYVTTDIIGALPNAAPIIETTSVDWLAFAAAIALFLWVAVAVAWVGLRLGDQRRVLRLARNDSIPAGAALQREANRIARELGLRRLPVIRLNENESGPLVMGLLQPHVFLPASFETTYDARERRLALAHEFGHIARGDLGVSFAATIFQAAQWPNPLAHVATKAFRTDQEAACDAYVLARCGGANAASVYASAIMKSVRGPEPAYGLSLGHPLKERLMLLKNSNASLARRFLGGVGAAALITAGLAATASYGYAAADDDKKEVIVEADPDVVTEKRVLVFTGVEDEVIFDDVVIGDRVRVMQFDDGEGEHRVIRVHGDGKGGEDVMKWVSKGDAGSWQDAGCIQADGEGEPVMLEFKDESGDEENKFVYHTVICLTGEEAKPENRAAALEKAISEMEDRAKEEEKRRKKMIQSLRKQAKELEKQQ